MAKGARRESGGEMKRRVSNGYERKIRVSDEVKGMTDG